MKLFAKIFFIAAVIQFSAATCFAADVKPAKAVGGAVTPVATAKDVAQTKSTDAKAKLIDINSAGEAELKSVPGIGDAYAAKIIAGRPYANKAQLKSRNVLPANVYELVKEKIIARQIKK